MEKRKQPETLRLRAVMPALTVNDVEASLAWYQDVVGFTAAEEMRHEGQLSGAMLQAGEMRFMIFQDDFQKGRDRAKGVGFRLYCTTAQDIDALAAGIKSRGGQLGQELTDQPWGARDFAIMDPDGFRISISTGFGES